jgi:hypothetical protein
LIAAGVAGDAAGRGAVHPEDASDVGAGAVALSMARISARLNSRIGQYRLPLLEQTARPRSLERAIPDLLAGPIKKAPINHWEHRDLGER